MKGLAAAYALLLVCVTPRVLGGDRPGLFLVTVEDRSGGEGRGPAHIQAHSVASCANNRFVLKPGADLFGPEAPVITGRAFTITAHLAESAQNGVIVAQGGNQHGFALYFRDGDLCFSLRRHRDLKTLSAKVDPVAEVKTITARLAADCSATLRVNGRLQAEGRMTGPVPVLPLEGLQVGCDHRSAVGDYEAPFPFAGTIRSIEMELGEKIIVGVPMRPRRPATPIEKGPRF